MKTANRVVTVIGVCLVVTGVAAQQSVEQAPGYFPLEELSIFADGNLEVDVDLKGPMIEMMAAAAEESEPQFAELADQLQRVRVRVGSLEGQDRATVEAEFERAINMLEGAGWDVMVRVDDGEEQVRVFVKQGTDTIQGLAVLVNDAYEEAVLVNIVGDFDPSLIGSLMSSMDDLDLDELGVDLGQD
jgi:hypothetical protein